MSGFHQGERALQEQFGLGDKLAKQEQELFSTQLQPSQRAFVESLPFLLVASLDQEDRPCCSLVHGPAGFIKSLSSNFVELDLLGKEEDPLWQNLQSHQEVGLLALDLAYQKRLRINGRVVEREQYRLLVALEQVFGNCPKFVQPLKITKGKLRQAPFAMASSSLTPSQREWITQAPFFFLATGLPGEEKGFGLDLSYKGCGPGWLGSASGGELDWPELRGNGYFNSLGNLVLHPWAALLFVDFSAGHLLQVGGKVALDYDSPRAKSHPHDVNAWAHLQVDRVLELRHHHPFFSQASWLKDLAGQSL